MLQIAKPKPSTNAYNRKTRRWKNTKCRVGNAKHLSPSLDIILTIQENNFNYHVCGIYYPRISSIQWRMNPQLSYEKHSLVDVQKSQ